MQAPIGEGGQKRRRGGDGRRTGHSIQKAGAPAMRVRFTRPTVSYPDYQMNLALLWAVVREAVPNGPH